MIFICRVLFSAAFWAIVSSRIAALMRSRRNFYIYQVFKDRKLSGLSL
jgi:hypothetical protein